MLREGFSAVAELVEVVHTPGEAVVRLVDLGRIDDAAGKVAHRVRAVYSEFVTSPWY